MSSIQEAISQNVAAVIAAVIEALPIRLEQVQIIPKDKETEILQKERA